MYMCCLFDLACFFLPSFSASLIKPYHVFIFRESKARQYIQSRQCLKEKHWSSYGRDNAYTVSSPDMFLHMSRMPESSIPEPAVSLTSVVEGWEYREKTDRNL